MSIRNFAVFLLIVFALHQNVYSQNFDKTPVLWCDPLLNIRQIYDARSITAFFDKAQQSGIEGIALGVKAITGEVIYDSKVAPKLLDWDGFRVPLNFDPVKTCMEEARKHRMSIYAVFSVFSEGQMMQRKGPIYNEHPEWQTQVYVVDQDKPRIMPISDWAFGSVAFANPILQEVQDYEIAVIEEFLEKYKVDGIILDRVRFSGIESDFSDATQKAFQQDLGETISWWPTDVYEWQYQNDQWQIVPGKYYEKWIEFRSAQIKKFVDGLVKRVRAKDRSIAIADFVGAWYPTYYEYGVNWANSNYRLRDADWVPSGYGKTSILNDFDYLVSACYFPRITMDEAENVGAEWWMSVEGAAEQSMEAVYNDKPVFGSIWAEQFKEDGQKFTTALRTVFQRMDGLYIYDLSQIQKYDLWDEVLLAVSASSRAP